MNWFFWRQHRKALLYTALGVIIYLLVTVIGVHLTRQIDYTPNLLYALLRMLPRFSLVLPLVISLFWGAPLLAREYEEGTTKLAWTQGISRRQWLLVKLLGLVGCTILLSALVAATLSWLSWSGARSHNQWGNRLSPGQFGITGIVPVAYSLFGLMLGVLMGAWRKRLLTAIALMLGVFVVVQLYISLNVRPHFQPPLTYSFLIRGDRGAPVTPKGWELSNSFTQSPQELRITATYQPADRYWDFQRKEAGIYLLLTLLATVATYQLVLRRDA